MPSRHILHLPGSLGGSLLPELSFPLFDVTICILLITFDVSPFLLRRLIGALQVVLLKRSQNQMRFLSLVLFLV